jgi:hypothetical protein
MPKAFFYTVSCVVITAWQFLDGVPEAAWRRLPGGENDLIVQEIVQH